MTEKLSTKKAAATLKTLRILLAYCGDDTLTARQVLTFLVVASRASGTVPQSQVEAETGQSRTVLSRSIVRLGEGTPKEPGLGLMVSTIDPEDRRYRVVTLTDKGRDLARLLAADGGIEG